MTDALQETKPSKKRVKKIPAPKAKGRPRNKNFLPWKEARELIQAEMIPSRGKFFDWWETNKPKSIPRFPYRVYVEEWVSWNDFLGTDNKFNDKIGTKWRPYHEAVLWAHIQKIETKAMWLEKCREGDFLPADIPARPDLVYPKWVSWNHWLGNKPTEAVAAKQQAKQVAIYYIIREQGAPSNVLTFGIEPNGMTALKDRWEYEKFEVVKLFWLNQEKLDTIQQIIQHYSTPYLGEDRQRIVPNVWDIIWYFDMIMDTVRG